MTFDDHEAGLRQALIGRLHALQQAARADFLHPCARDTLKAAVARARAAVDALDCDAMARAERDAFKRIAQEAAWRIESLESACP